MTWLELSAARKYDAVGFGGSAPSWRSSARQRGVIRFGSRTSGSG
jgi:hypothetical protein